jgi:hypothetical protein
MLFKTTSLLAIRKLMTSDKPVTQSSLLQIGLDLKADIGKLVEISQKTRVENIRSFQEISVQLRRVGVEGSIGLLKTEGSEYQPLRYDQLDLGRSIIPGRLTRAVFRDPLPQTKVVVKSYQPNEGGKKVGATTTRL